MFKKCVIFLLTCFMVFSMAACGAEEKSDKEESSTVIDSNTQQISDGELPIIGNPGNQVIIVDVPMSEMEELDLYSPYFVAQPNKNYLPAPYLQMWDMGFRIADNHTEQFLVPSGFSETVILEDTENNLKISCDFYNETGEEYAQLVSCKTYNITVLQGNDNLIFPKGITIGTPYEKIKKLSEQYYCVEYTDSYTNTIGFEFYQYPINYGTSMTNTFVKIKIDQATGLVKEMTKQNDNYVDYDNPPISLYYSSRNPDTTFEMYGHGGAADGQYSWPIKLEEEVAQSHCSFGFYLDDDAYVQGRTYKRALEGFGHKADWMYSSYDEETGRGVNIHKRLDEKDYYLDAYVYNKYDKTAREAHFTLSPLFGEILSDAMIEYFTQYVIGVAESVKY